MWTGSSEKAHDNELELRNHVTFEELPLSQYIRAIGALHGVAALFAANASFTIPPSNTLVLEVESKQGGSEDLR